MNRFFSEKYSMKVGDCVEVSEKKLYRHIIKSLRLEPGDRVEFCFKDKAEFCAEISNIEKNSVFFTLVEEFNIDRELPVVIDLFQGVPKSKKMDYIIQKTVEAGVNSITPVDMERSISKLTVKEKSVKFDRFAEISLSAAEQSKRQIVPVVNSAIHFKKLKEYLKEYDIVFLADEAERIKTLKNYENEVLNSKKIAIIVGPEGGISNIEREELFDLAKSISLGKRILRTETAGVYLLAQLSYLLA